MNDLFASAEFQAKVRELTGSFSDSPEALSKIRRLERQYPDRTGTPKYERSGHQYTTYIVAMAAGLGRDRSYEVAYFSQFPDDERQFSATLAFFYLFDLEYRKQIMAVLHSLHGGNQAAVLKRRRVLWELLDGGIRNKYLEDFQIGLITHAFADSYAHTEVRDGSLHAFDYIWGHLFHGHKPDIVAYDPDKYREYSCALFIALASNTSCLPQLSELHLMIERLKTSRNAELPEFKKYAETQYRFDSDVYEGRVNRWQDLLSKESVVETIGVIENRIGNEH